MRMRDGTKLPIMQDARRRFQLHAYAVLPDMPVRWHRRLMHAGNAALRRLGESIPVLRSGAYDFSACDACLSGGMVRRQVGNTQRRPIPDSQFRRDDRKKYKDFGDCISSDLIDFGDSAYNNHRYGINFCDRATKYVAVYSLANKEKETIIASFAEFLRDHEQFLPTGVKRWHTDNGGEFYNNDMEQFCSELSIRRTYSTPYVPAQNPMAERTWSSILRRMRIVMAEQNTPMDLWPYAFKQAALVHNVLVGGHHQMEVCGPSLRDNDFCV